MGGKPSKGTKKDRRLRKNRVSRTIRGILPRKSGRARK